MAFCLTGSTKDLLQGNTCAGNGVNTPSIYRGECSMRRIIVALCLMAGSVTVGLAPAPAGASAVWSASGSVNQVYVTDLAPGAPVALSQGPTPISSGVADSAGGYLFRSVPAGSGYLVTSGAETSASLTVTDPSQNPDDSWYASQASTNPLSAGYGYMTTRDGTKLSVNVTFPADGSPGPWPVVVNYSGYSPAAPGPPPQESLLYIAQGYVVVGVNMRGTGCSGGAFEFMETLQSLDGYDMVETLAHQSWSNGDVGLVGISYSGYSQLYVAATQPPHLRAITPLSPFSDTYSGILYPGGILNDGFAVGWASDRENGAKPRAAGWARDRIAGGDTICADNQDLRLQSKPLLQRIHNTPFADHEFDYLNTETFVNKIKVPTYLASQWQDEQTGGSAANLIPLFDPATKVFASFTNGVHVEPMAPSEFLQAMAFIDIYVGKRVPHVDPLVTALAPGALADLFHSTKPAAFAMPANPWASQPNLAAAKAAYEAQPRIRIRWENGSVSGSEGLPLAPTETRHANWPLDGLTAEKLYLQPDGALGSTPASVPDSAARASSSYTYDPTTKRNQTFDGSTDEVWAAHPDLHWNVLKEGNSLSYLSAPYASKVAYAGEGSVDLWVRSSAPDTDIEATLTEVRPDGEEVYIQSGWLRASHRKLEADRSTELVPYQDHQAADAAPLPAGQFTKVRVEMFPFAHVVRPGSRLRLNIEAPGGNQPFWAFETLPGTSTNEIGHSTAMASRVVLPRVPANQTPVVPAALPPCSLPGVTTQAVSLRNQPCRAYRPARVASGVVASAHGTSATVTWQPAPGAVPTSYRVQASAVAGTPAGTQVPAPVTVAGGDLSAEVAGLPYGVAVEFRVTALFGTTPAPASDASLPIQKGKTPIDPTGPTTPPDGPGGPVGPFDSASAFVSRQLSDFTGSAKPAAVAAGLSELGAGTSPSAYIAGLATGSDSTTVVDPVSRLYLAYFGRLADAGGLNYWAARHRNGLDLDRISAAFAASPEFVHTYGSLSNRAFVELVYRNVLGRGGEVSGAGYWTAQLDTHRMDRGRVMTGFSEAPEYRRLVGDQVAVGHLYVAMLHRAPTAAEERDALARLAGGTGLATLASEMLGSSDYARLIG